MQWFFFTTNKTKNSNQSKPQISISYYLLTWWIIIPGSRCLKKCNFWITIFVRAGICISWFWQKIVLSLYLFFLYVQQINNFECFAKHDKGLACPCHAFLLIANDPKMVSVYSAHWGKIISKKLLIIQCIFKSPKVFGVLFFFFLLLSFLRLLN